MMLPVMMMAPAWIGGFSAHDERVSSATVTRRVDDKQYRAAATGYFLHEAPEPSSDRRLLHDVVDVTAAANAEASLLRAKITRRTVKLDDDEEKQQVLLPPSWCPQQQPVPKLPYGVLSATADFGADPTGATDSTAQLQHALTAARTNNVTIFLPLGCYRVTDQLNATVPRNGRWQPVVLVGQRVKQGGRRPTLFLPPSTPGFGDGPSGRALLTYRCDWCLAPGPDPAKVASGCLYGTCCSKGVFKSSGGYNFNGILESVDIDIATGNPNAVGVNMGGAQGSAINEVTVRAASDALACVSGGNVGGSFARLTVIGARFGLDMRVAQAPTLVGVSVLNSSCAGIVYGGGPSLTATGLYVEGRAAIGGVVVGYGGRGKWMFPHPIPSHCLLVPFSPHYESSEQSVSSPWPISVENSASTSLVDGVIVLHGANSTSAPCVLSNSSLYMNKVWLSGCSDLVKSAKRPPLLASPGCPYSHVELLGLGRLVPSAAGRWDRHNHSMLPAHGYSYPATINGVRHPKGIVRLGPGCSAPPPELQSKHLWPEENAEGGTTWQTAGAVDAVEECGAKGDGVSDDWAALQRCVAQHEVVVLPKGFFRVSRTLTITRGALVGVGRTLSYLVPTSDAPSNGTDWPLLDVVATVTDSVHIGWMTFACWDHLPHVFAVRHHSANTASTWRQSFQNRLTEATFPPLLALAHQPPPPPRAGAAFDRALVELRGSIVAYDFNLDFGCCFGTYQPPRWENATPGAGIASSGEILLQGSSYRTLLMDGAHDVRFYAHNTEQDFGNAHTEIYRSFNVSLFGTKSEGNNVDVWIRDSDLVSIHGYGGNAAAFANDTDFNDP